MSERFFSSQKPIDDRISLDGDQAHHALKVMRLKVGDSMILFDGAGKEFEATIEATGKKTLDLRIDSTRSIQPVLPNRITLGIALPKGDRQKFLVEKLVELGVFKLVPLQTNHSVAVASDKVVARVRKNVIEASKQCRRAWLMEVSDSMSLCEFVAMGESESAPDKLKVVADPYCQRSFVSVCSKPQPVNAVVGPEGGLDDSEMRLLYENGWQSVSLGQTILRIETAAIVLASLAGIGADNSSS